MVWSERVRLSDGAFRRRYRMPKETFTSLCGTLAGPMAEMHGLLGHRIPHGVSVELQVSVSIRWLAGGSYLDIADVHGASNTTLYQSRHAFLFALVHHPRCKIEFPLHDCANPANYKNRKGVFAVIAQVCGCARGSPSPK